MKIILTLSALFFAAALPISSMAYPISLPTPQLSDVSTTKACSDFARNMASDILQADNTTAIAKHNMDVFIMVSMQLLRSSEANSLNGTPWYYSDAHNDSGTTLSAQSQFCGIADAKNDALHQKMLTILQNAVRQAADNDSNVDVHMFVKYGLYGKYPDCLNDENKCTPFPTQITL